METDKAFAKHFARIIQIGDSGVDWTRWESETVRSYLIRLASQVVFAAGTLVDSFGADTRDRLWGWADMLLEIAHPTPDPVDIDLGEDIDPTPEKS